MPPLLADGTPYVAGMPLWGFTGLPVGERFFAVYGAEPVWYDGPGSGWYLGGMDLRMFWPSREAWSRSRMAALRDEVMEAMMENT